ncbi:MAG: sodium-independent anion transporter [Deltaproteobacteria bacterium]|nr:MAG: sodium-independent anion transporter [Deltaproteobacteria bacterium]
MHVPINHIAPFIPWLRRYNRHYLKVDLFAGLTVAVVALPQSMAYAMIAGLPVQYGLYASIIPTIIGCLWGSSAQLITGPTTTASLVVFSALSAIATPGSNMYIELAFLLAAMAGLIRLALGAARLGVLLNFVSHSVLLGFTTGAAVLIAFKQLPGLLGIEMARDSNFARYLLNLITRLPSLHPMTHILGLITIAIILITRRYRPAWPGTLIAMIVVGALVAGLKLDQYHVRVVGAIPAGLPPFHLPSWRLISKAGQLAPAALAIAILGLMEAISIAQTIADQTHQRLNINREFIGQGLANLSASVFSGYPCSGSFTRSAVNYRAGAKTPMSGIISGIAVALAVVLAGPLAAKLPRSALAGVLIVVAYQLIHVDDIRRTLRATRSDAAVLIVTFLVTVFVNISFSIYVGVLLSIGLHLSKTSHPRIHPVVPSLETGKIIEWTYGMATCKQLDIIQIEGSVFFGAAAFVLNDLQRRLRHHPEVPNLLIRMHSVNTIDASGVHILEIILNDIHERDGGLYFCGVNHQVFNVFSNSGLLEDLGHGHIHKSTKKAVRKIMQESFCPVTCAACSEIVFKECPDLKKGNWEIFGEGVQPKRCHLPDDKKTLTRARFSGNGDKHTECRMDEKEER